MIKKKIIDEKHAPPARFLMKQNVLQARLSIKMRRRPDIWTESSCVL